MDPLRSVDKEVDTPLLGSKTRKLRFRGWIIVLLAIVAWALVTAMVVFFLNF